MTMFPMYGFFDPTYILIIIGVIITLAASAKMNSAFRRYSKVRSHSGLAWGHRRLRKILNYAGIYDVVVERVSGNLTDHYDPRSKVLRLSDATYNATSVAAIGVAAHECGHAMQDKEAYAPLKLRGSLVPVANIGSNLSWSFHYFGYHYGGQSDTPEYWDTPVFIGRNFPVSNSPGRVQCIQSCAESIERLCDDV